MTENVKTFEILNPKFTLPKHGYTKIELKDIHTGKKEVYEDENMMTKALDYFLADTGWMADLDNNLYNNSTDMVTRLLGGIMLFDGAIPEDNECVLPPNNLNMIANGAVGVINNGEPLELGSYSSTESGWQQDGSYVQVYDYSTTQGNGHIASACLTSRSFGYIGHGNASGAKTSNSEFDIFKHSTGNQFISFTYMPVKEAVLAVDPVQSVFYSIPCGYIHEGIDNTLFWPNSGKIVINKRRIPFSIIDVRSRFYNYDFDIPLVSSMEINVPQNILTAVASINKYDAYLHPYIQNGHLHIAFGNYGSVWSNDNPIMLMTVNYDGTVKTYSIGNISSETEGWYIPNNSRYDFHYDHLYDDGDEAVTMTVPKKGTSYGSYDWSKIEMLDFGDEGIYDFPGLLQPVDGFTLTQNVTDTPEWIPIGQGVYCTRYGKIALQGYPYVEPINNYVSGSRDAYEHAIVLGNPLLYFGNQWYNGRCQPRQIYRNINYIASINNLETPVTKTDDKTMKITYRITF